MEVSFDQCQYIYSWELGRLKRLGLRNLTKVPYE